jgi:D-glycero-D-manno-heptose 1,7-bisphosphate phosphatase
MRAIFLDRDGVISENRNDHVKSWKEFRFIPGVLDALARLHQAGFPLFIVTNQAIVNRGIITTQELEDMHARMLEHVVQHGGFIDDIRYCPHYYGENCACRKPRPGMLIDLAARWQVNLASSYLIGDAWTDIAAGRAAGCHTVMVQTGRGIRQAALPEARENPADHVAADLHSAIDWIDAQTTHPQPSNDQHIRSQSYLSISRNMARLVGEGRR